MTDRIIVCENKNFENVTPNFIYNRPDLMPNCESYLLFFSDKEMYIPLKIKANEATLCTWGMSLSYQEVSILIEFVMEKYKNIDKVNVMRVDAEDGTYPDEYLKNDFSIELPVSRDELDMRLSKKGRYNIKREKRIAGDDFGNCQLVHLEISDSDAVSITSKFFELKKKNMGSDYGMSAENYLKNWYVTDIYYLTFGDTIVSVLMSCEQCEEVYLENITYDDAYSNYSPGQIAYDFYLKELIDKGKKKVFLLGGNYDYKKRYGSKECNVAEFSVVRKSLKSYAKIYGKRLLIDCFNKMPTGIKNLYLSRRK